jgi:hypothetical protein
MLAVVSGSEVQFIPSGDVAALFPTPVDTARKTPSSEAHVTSRRKVNVLGVLDVQLTPSGDVMARLAPDVVATAQKRFSSGAQQRAPHTFTGADCAVHAMPSGDVITVEAARADCATAQKIPSSGAQQTAVHVLLAALARLVHVMPSGDVITRLPTPLLATAQNRPRSADQHTLSKA